MRLLDAARGRAEPLLLVLAAVAAAGAAGAVSATSARLAVAVIAGVLLIGLAAGRPVVLAVIALAGVFASQRLGSSPLVAGNPNGISYSDAFLAAAATLSVPALLGKKEIRRLRLAAWGVAIYLACLLPTVLLHSSQRGYLEWLHRLLLLGGSLLVGAWIAREGKIRPALRWLAVIACVVAAATVIQAVRHGWLHSSAFGLNKNFVGSLLAAVLVVVFIARDHLALPTAWWVSVLSIIGAGTIASHSRGGALAASVGLFLAFLLTRGAHKRGTKALAVLVAAVLAVFVYTTVRSQLDQPKTAFVNSSLGVRFNVERETRSIWRTSPIYGVGLKYFNTGQFGIFAQAANNVVDNELAESGDIGLAGFLALQAVVLLAGLRRGRREQLAAAGFGAVAGLLAHGMVDIYWTAGTVTLPFIVMGMALAHEPSHDHRRPGRQRNSNGQARARSTNALCDQQGVEASALAVVSSASENAS